MTRPIRLSLLAVLLVLAVTAAAIPALLPPLAGTTAPPHWRAAGTTVRGAYHVHSTASDGTGSLDEIAAAAARAGLQFVIVTDHGDGARVPEPPRYRSGVLCIEAVEINTTGGHLVALGAAPSAYPLAGTPRSVIEDVHRLGGIGVAAHPGSPRASLQWTSWDVPLDGIEWLNADSEWRDELIGSLGRLMLTYAFRPAETLASILDRPDTVMARWDAAGRRAKTIGLAGSDAHARLGFRQQTDPYAEGLHLELPSYETSFRTFSTHVMIDAPLSGDAGRDAAAVIDHLRRGRTYTVVDGVATPGAFEFSATSGGVSALMGGDIDIAGEVVLHARMAAPAGTRMVVLRDGSMIFDTFDLETHVNVVAAPGVYRVEIHAPGGRGTVPWLVSNPIYVGLREAHARAAAGTPRAAVSARSGVATESWVAEASPDSSSQLHPNSVVDGVAGLEWQFSLGEGAAAGQYAALRFPVEGGLAGYDRLQIRTRVDRPMRAWVQLRASTMGMGERWGQTIFLDSTLRGTDVFFADMAPLGATSSERPPLDAIDSLLLVVDTLNTRPGATGRIQLAEMWLARP